MLLPMSTPADPHQQGPAQQDAPQQDTEVDLLLRVARRWRRLGQGPGADSGDAAGDLPHQLSPHQERALLALARLTRRAEEDGSPAPRVSHLADHLGIARRSATEVADALESAGLLTRAPDPTDRRAVLLTLTGEGLHTVSAVRDRRRAAAEEAVSTLAAADRAELRRLLLALLDGTPPPRTSP